MKHSRRKTAATVIEIAAMIILTVILAVMFAWYCFLKNTSSVSTATVSEHSFLQVKAPDTEDAVSESPDILAPSFIGIVMNGKQYTPVSSQAREAVMKDIKPFLLEAFSDLSTPAYFSTDALKFDYIGNIIAENTDYIHLSFAQEIPAGSIVPMLGGYTLDDIFHAFNVKDLLIFCTNDGQISAIAVDNDLNMTSLSVRRKSSLSFEPFLNFENTHGVAKYEYILYNNKNFPVIRSSVAFSNLAAYNYSGDFTDNAEAVSTVLDTFGFNPNSTSSYHDENGITFVEALGEISLLSDGSISYSASGNGIPLSNFCDSVKSVYSAEEKMISARNIISSLDRNVFGRDAVLSLYSASHSDGLFTLKFSYTLDGMTIDDAKNSATLVFDDDSLIFADIRAKGYAALDSTFTDIPQKLLFVFSTATATKNSKTPLGFSPVYSLASDGNVYNARFALLYDDTEYSKEKEVSAK